MIELTTLSGKTFYLNPHQIEQMEANPDTVLFMLSGKTMVVKEDTATVIERIVAYRRRCGALGGED